MKDVILTRANGAQDLIPLFIGEEECAKGHSFGPYVRDYHLIHFCLRGKGTLWDKFGTHEIKAGELFIIRKGETTVYTADVYNPWHYVWIAFAGSISEIFSTDNSVYEAPAEIKERLCALISSGELNPHAYTAILYELIYRLFKYNSNPSDILGQIKEYIDYNYMENLSVDMITGKFGFERSYLYRIFKKRYGVGIKEYIIKVRMTRAKKFLEDGHSVCDTAHIVGYQDEFNFSKAFSKYFSAPPSSFKGKIEI